MTATLKLPYSDRPLINDPDLARFVLEAKRSALANCPPKDRERAEERIDAAIRRVHGSGIMGSFSQMCTAYRVAIAKAVGSDKET